MPSFLFVIPIAVLGWACGAFVNYLSDVLPYRRRFARPFCLACQAPVPPVNYFFWPRRCPACTKPRPARTWLVEAVFVALTLWTWFRPSEMLGFWLGLAVMVFFGVVVVIDIEHRLILHPVSLVGAALGLLVGVIVYGTRLTNEPTAEASLFGLAAGTLPFGLAKSLLGGLFGFGIMFVFFYLGNLLAKLIGRLRGEPVGEDALGYGDVILSGVLGLMVAWDRIIYALFLGVLAGAIFSAGYLIFKTLARKYQLFTAIPYGPFLVAGAAFILF